VGNLNEGSLGPQGIARLSPGKPPHGPARPKIFHAHPNERKNPEGGNFKALFDEEAEKKDGRKIKGKNEGQDKKNQQRNSGAQMAEGVHGRVEPVIGAQIEKNSEKKA